MNVLWSFCYNVWLGLLVVGLHKIRCIKPFMCPISKLARIMPKTPRKKLDPRECFVCLLHWLIELELETTFNVWDKKKKWLGMTSMKCGSHSALTLSQCGPVHLGKPQCCLWSSFLEALMRIMAWSPTESLIYVQGFFVHTALNGRGSLQRTSDANPVCEFNIPQNTPKGCRFLGSALFSHKKDNDYGKPKFQLGLKNLWCGS